MSLNPEQPPTRPVPPADARVGAREEFEDLWWSGEPPRIEDYLPRGDDRVTRDMLCELIRLELKHRRRLGEVVTPAEYRSRFPAWADVVDDAFRTVPAASTTQSAASASLSTFIGDDRTSAPDSPGVRQRPASTRGAGATFGDFELIREIGRGGMGIVYEAHHRERGDRVALKTMPRMDGRTLYQFKQEFRSLSGLAHPALVGLYELVADGDQWFFTVEFVEGEDFLSHARPGGRLDAARLRVALAGLFRGISALHGAGKLHRDIKPSNVLVTAAGRVVLLDFGLAMEVEQRRWQQSTEQHFVGTIPYMAPEQAAQAAGRRATATAPAWCFTRP